MIELTVRVTTIRDRYPVERIAGQLASWEGTQRMDPRQMPVTKKADRFASLNPNGAARVKVGLEEKLSGPSGTYSSVSVSIEISTRCDQNDKAIEETRDVLFAEGTRALEHYMGPALNLLIEHTERQQK